ncbi:hypothetical protein EST54_17950, partial [Streptomyces sioyaensis]
HRPAGRLHRPRGRVPGRGRGGGGGGRRVGGAGGLPHRGAGVLPRRGGARAPRRVSGVGRGVGCGRRGRGRVRGLCVRDERRADAGTAQHRADQHGDIAAGGDQQQPGGAEHPALASSRGIDEDGAR